jgi:DNA-binding transcriptional ArsR family regulator
MRPVQENDVFHAIAHPARRAILVTLKEGERAASDLAEPFRMTFAAISQHLRVLEEAALVSVRRDGRQRLYRLDPRPLRDVVTWADEFAAFFGQRLDALGTYLDRKHGKRR